MKLSGDSDKEKQWQIDNLNHFKNINKERIC